MLDSPTGLATTTDLVDEPMTQPPSAVPAAEVSSTEVLITTQEVLFGTAAAVRVPRENIGGRFLAMMRRVFATSTDASRPQPRYVPKRYGFLEDALMAREMERL
jgi:putative transposon-encoded protein